jgi:putative transposase
VVWGVFTPAPFKPTKLLTQAFKLLSIKRQTSDVACPWQNGRIERCFGTFKQKWRQVTLISQKHLQVQLANYQTWYNVIRPHSNLDGRTPAEAFMNKTVKGELVLVTGWNVVLVGYYFPDNTMY